jgi:hypothetical protein
MNAFANFPADEPLRETLHPDIYVEERDRDPAGEELRQAEYIATMRKSFRAVKVFAVPNGAKRTPWEAGKVKREGLYAGWPDTGACWGISDRGNAAWIEWKNGRDMPDDNQIATLNWLHAHGFPVAVCRTSVGALSWLQKVGAPVSIREGL